MANLGQMLQQILRGRAVKQTFVQAKPDMAKPRQTLIGAARGKAVDQRSAAVIQQLVFLSSVASTIADQGKQSNFSMTAALHDLQSKVHDLRSSEAEVKEFASLMEMQGRLLASIDQAIRQLIMSMSQFESVLQTINAAASEERSKAALRNNA
jgi:signal transduction histidine kinase